MKYATHCDTGRRKEINEDSIATAVFEDEHLDDSRDVGAFVLADGAGGEERGDVASYIATTAILERLSANLYPLLASEPDEVGVDLSDVASDPPSSSTPGSAASGTGPGDDESVLEALVPGRLSPAAIESLLEKAVQTAQRRILAYAREASVDNVYTTVVAGIYADGRLHYAWVGDSPAFVVNAEAERIDRLTEDHSRVRELEREGLVDDAEAKVHLEGNAISRALGGKASHSPDRAVEVDTNSVPLYETDVVLFTSDGLVDAYPHIEWLYQRYQRADERERLAEQIWDTTVTDDEIRDLLLGSIGAGGTETDLQRAARTLVAAGNNRGGKDNMSVILFSSESASSHPDELPDRGPASSLPDEDLSGETVIDPADSSSSDSSTADSPSRDTSNDGDSSDTGRSRSASGSDGDASQPDTSSNGGGSRSDATADRKERRSDADRSSTGGRPRGESTDRRGDADGRESTGRASTPGPDGTGRSGTTDGSSGPNAAEGTGPTGGAIDGVRTDDPSRGIDAEDRESTGDDSVGENAAAEFPITDLSEETPEDDASDETDEQTPILASVAGTERYEVVEGAVVELRRGGVNVSTGSPSGGHARLERTAGGDWTLVDLGSGQSTYVLTKQGTRVKTRLDGSDDAAPTEATLSDGSVVAFGKTSPKKQYEFRQS